MAKASLVTHFSRAQLATVGAAALAVLLALAGLALVHSAESGTKAAEARQAMPIDVIPTNPRPSGQVAVDDQQAMAMAVATGNSVEVLSEREPAAEVFAQPDGTWLRREWLAPVWVQTGGDGDAVEDWSPVSLELVPGADGAISPQAYPGELTFLPAEDSGDALVSWVIPGTEVVVDLLAPASPMPAPVIEGARARYLDIAPGVDLVIDVMPTGYEKFFVIHDREALEANGDALVLKYRIVGGSIQESAAGLDVMDGTGAVVGTMPVAFGWDADEDPYIATPVLSPWAVEGENPAAIVSERMAAKVPLNWEFTVQGDIATVRMIPPQDWLGNEATAFPVVVDPVWYSPQAGADMHIRNNYPNNSYPSELEFIIGRDPTYGHLYRSFIGVNTSTMKTLDVLSGTFVAWNYWSATCTAMPWSAYWTDYPSSSFTWNNQPTYYVGPTYSWETRGYNSSCAQTYIGIDITPFMAGWKASSSNYQGVMIQPSSFNNSAQWKRFRSLESSSPNKPYFAFQYNRAPNTPTALAYTPPSGTTRGQLSATVSDPDATYSQVRALFTLERRPVGSTSEDDWEVMFDQAEGSLVSNGQTSIREVDLIAGFEYRVKARAHDTRIPSAAYTATVTFEVQDSWQFPDVPPGADGTVNNLSLVTASAVGGSNDA